MIVRNKKLKHNINCPHKLTDSHIIGIFIILSTFAHVILIAKNIYDE